MTLEMIVKKMGVKRELKDQIDAAIEAAFKALEPTPHQRPVKRRKMS